MATAKQEWVPLYEAANRTGLTVRKLGQIVKAGQLEVRKNIKDERQKLVNLEALRNLLYVS